MSKIHHKDTKIKQVLQTADLGKPGFVPSLCVLCGKYFCKLLQSKLIKTMGIGAD